MSYDINVTVQTTTKTEFAPNNVEAEVIVFTISNPSVDDVTVASIRQFLEDKLRIIA